jgi:hypothetical protein
MTSHSAIARDPWTWTVDELVAQICHSSSLYRAAKCRPDDIPNTVLLESQLRNQEVTGATFLTLESNALRSELGIQNLDQRMVLHSVIDLLRQQSAAYGQRTATAGVQALGINKVQVPPPERTSGTSDNLDVPGPSGRKRQKTTHVTATPISAARQAPPASSALFTNRQEQPTVEGSGEWDYLLRWEQRDEHMNVEEMVTDAEEDIEDEVEGLEERSNSVESLHDAPTELSDEAEDTVEVPGRSKLKRDETVDIINEQIERYTTAWKPNQAVLKEDEIEYDPEDMWQKAEASGERPRFIEAYRKDAAYYRNRLDKLCDAILNDPGSTREKVRHQCRNLEITVNSIELSEWLLSIYSLDPADSSDDEDPLPDYHARTELSHGPAQQAEVSYTQPPIIIDLGSPPESSQSEMDGVLVDSSLPPELLLRERQSSSSPRSHTLDSVIAKTIEPPGDMLVTARASTSRPRGQLGDEPEKASIASARRWKWSELVDTRDRKRIVTKALHGMKTEDRETIRNRLKTVGKADLIREIPACIRMLAKNETKMPGVLLRDMPKIITFSRLFLCWWLCDNYFHLEPSRWHLKELEQRLQEGSPDPSTFCDYLNAIMATTFSPEALRNPEQPSQAEIIEISDDDEPPLRPPATKRSKPAQGTQQTRQPPTIFLD